MGRHEEFIGAVKHRARLLSTVQAERAVGATLQVLSELVPSDLAVALAGELPGALGGHLRSPQGAITGAPLDRRRFILRIAHRTDLDEPDAAFLCLAVFERLNATLTQSLMTEVRLVVPRDLLALASAVPPCDVPPATVPPRPLARDRVLVRAVRQPAGVGSQARRAGRGRRARGHSTTV